MKHEVKTVQRMLVLLIAAAMAVCGIFYLDTGHIRQASAAEYEPGEHLRWSVETVDVRSGTLYVEGWLMEPGDNQGQYETTAALREPGAEICECLPTQMAEREDVTKSEADGINYDDAGFVAKALCDKLHLMEKTYDLVLLHERNGKKYMVDTGIVLEKGVPKDERK